MLESPLQRAGWERVVIVASGPSFDAEQAQQIVAARSAQQCRVIAVNDNYRRIPNADLLYACDKKWWEFYYEAVEQSGFAGELWTQDVEACALYPKLRRIPLHNAGTGLTKHPGSIHGGGNSGYQAINLAYLFGACRITLVGFDMQKTRDQYHWFGKHPQGLINPTGFEAWVRRFEALAADLRDEGVDLVNCSKETALTCVRRSNLETELELDAA